MFHNVVQVIPYDDYKVYVYFEDGKIVCFDASVLLGKKVFAPLSDKHFFCLSIRRKLPVAVSGVMDACTILNDTLAWDLTGTRDETQCLDIDPDVLYALDHVSEKIA